MRRFNDLERAHIDLQRRHGKQANRLEQLLFKLHKQTQLKENMEGQMKNAEAQLKQLDELIAIKEATEKKDKRKLARMKEAILKVGALQEKANDNNQKQCDYITELLVQVDMLKRRLKESEEARSILDSLCKQ